MRALPCNQGNATATATATATTAAAPAAIGFSLLPMEKIFAAASASGCGASDASDFSGR